MVLYVLYNIKIGSAVLSWITKRYDPSVAITLSVLIYILESIIIALFIFEDEEVKREIRLRAESAQDVSASINGKPIPTFKPFIRFHANIGINPFSLHQSKHRRISEEPSLGFALGLYIFYLLFIDSINKGFGAIKV